MMMTIAISANAMSFSAARSEALFLSDKMAYELNLTNAQYNDVYEINLDYMLSVNNRNDVYGTSWSRRNTDLKYVLTVYQYNKYVSKSYFYRPMSWNNGNWNFNVYSHYSDKKHFYKDRPSNYSNYYGKNGKHSDGKHSDAKPHNTNPNRNNNTTSRHSTSTSKNSGSQLALNSTRGNPTSKRGSGRK